MNKFDSHIQSNLPLSPFAQLLTGLGAGAEPVVARRGATIRGKYMASAGLITYGGKVDGVLTAFDRSHGQLADGAVEDFYVVKEEDDDAPPELSYIKARAVAAENLAWSKAGVLFQSQATVKVQVKDLATRKSDGAVTGLRVIFEGLSGFVPKSAVGSVALLNNKLGQELDVKVIKVDRQENDLYFSHRLVLDEHEAAVRSALSGYLAEIKVGTVLTGRVAKSKDFGAFVDVGPLEGLVPVREIPGRNAHSLVSGKEIEVEVIGVNLVDCQLTLSISRPLNRAFVAELAVGQVLPGRVQRINDYAAFVGLTESFDGFLHFSDVAQSFAAARNLLAAKTEIYVEVKNIDRTNCRVGLSFVSVKES